MASWAEVAEAMAEALAPIAAEFDNLQIRPILNYNPTPPSIDIYPADPFQTPSGFGLDTEAVWVVRARTSTADHESGQLALLRLLDRRDPASVEQALTVDTTLGGTVESCSVLPEAGVSGYREYLDDPQSNSKLIGCEWRVEVTR